MEKGQQILLDYFESTAHKRDKWKKRNKFYQKTIEQQFAFIIPERSTVLELGCSTGDLLNAVKPSKGIGVDFSPTAINIAKQKYPHLEFYLADAHDFILKEDIDYIIVSDLITSLWDVQAFFRRLRSYEIPWQTFHRKQTKAKLPDFGNQFGWQLV